MKIFVQTIIHTGFTHATHDDVVLLSDAELEGCTEDQDLSDILDTYVRTEIRNHIDGHASFQDENGKELSVEQVLKILKEKE